MMKRLFISLAVLLVLGIASTGYTAGIPVVVDPTNAPEIWTQEVYNYDSVALTSGTAVVWAMSSDTADTSYAYRTSWVDQTTTADDINFAGIVVSDTIASKGTGTICIYGPVYARVADSSDPVTADQAVGTAPAEGQLGGATAADDKAIAGWSILAAPVAVSLGGYGGTDGVNGYMQPVFINPTPMVN